MHPFVKNAKVVANKQKGGYSRDEKNQMAPEWGGA
jgi:hypothetical protein